MLPHRAIPYTVRLLPYRDMHRRLMLEPKCTVSKTDAQLPRRTVPYTERLEPIRQNARTLTADPTLM
jgi:hypothetical protein